MTDLAAAWIGGDQELDPDLLEGEAAEPALDGTLLASGRSALRTAVLHLRGTVDVFLLPAYLCDTMLPPFADVPWELYGVGAAFEPDAEALAAQIGSRRACLVVVDFFGFPPRNAGDLRALGATIVEDAAHGSLVELPDAAAGRLGDVALTSFRKFLPVPDGALLRGADVVPGPADEALAGRRVHAKLLRRELLAGGRPELEDEALALVQAHERNLAATVAPTAISAVSRRLLGRLDLADAARRRRANFTALRAEIDGFAGVAPLFADLPDGVSPALFPLRVEGRDRDALRAELVRRRVFCPVHWPLPAEVEPERFPAEAKLSAQMLGLPLDQRYEPEHMREVVRRLHGAWRAVG